MISKYKYLDIFLNQYIYNLYILFVINKYRKSTLNNTHCITLQYYNLYIYINKHKIDMNLSKDWSIKRNVIIRIRNKIEKKLTRIECSNILKIVHNSIH